MTIQEENILRALNAAKASLEQMIDQGFGDTKYLFALESMLSDNFNLSQDQTLIVIEEALKII